ncbi:hypothetical protein [Paractinoplanes durhamensis]|uniref:hypothetical protein n=1 Tax=Paractinoplanes durhamensis TaxID=113563 RepID=UPI00362AA548
MPFAAYRAVRVAGGVGIERSRCRYPRPPVQIGTEQRQHPVDAVQAARRVGLRAAVVHQPKPARPRIGQPRRAAVAVSRHGVFQSFLMYGEGRPQTPVRVVEPGPVDRQRPVVLGRREPLVVTGVAGPGRVFATGPFTAGRRIGRGRDDGGVELAGRDVGFGRLDPGKDGAKLGRSVSQLLAAPGRAGESLLVSQPPQLANARPGVVRDGSEEAAIFISLDIGGISEMF